MQVVKLYFQYHLYFERSNSPATNCELHLLLTLSHKSQVLPLTVHQIIKIKEKYRIESHKSNKHSIKKNLLWKFYWSNGFNVFLIFPFALCYQGLILRNSRGMVVKSRKLLSARRGNQFGKVCKYRKTNEKLSLT